MVTTMDFLKCIIKMCIFLILLMQSEIAAETCRPDQITCYDGACIEGSQRCDGIKDCSQGEDESDGCYNDFATASTTRETTTGTLSSTSTSSTPCSIDEFQCQNGICIKDSFRCDNFSDCFDNSDEENCDSTSSSTTSIPTVTTTSISTLTDDQVSTESTVPTAGTCRPDQLTCYDGACIAASQRCDGIKDCSQGEDESDGCYNDLATTSTTRETTSATLSSTSTSSTPCSIDEFQCQNGICIKDSFRCDNFSDCFDNSDEENCDSTNFTQNSPSSSTISIPAITTTSISTSTDDQVSSESPVPIAGTCRPDQIICYDGACIEGSQRCDGIKDCSQGEDEGGCYNDLTTTSTTLETAPTPCSNDEFLCKNGICISDRLRCDNFTDCLDKSDEENCPPYISLPLPLPSECLSNEFKCEEEDDGSCINLVKRCNGQVDCTDGSDEENCPKRSVCLPSEYGCDDGHCIPLSRRCDKIPDCRDRSDELKCECASDEFRCSDGHCVLSIRRCDGVADCRDQSDEHSCPTTTTPAPECRLDEFRCNDGYCVPLIRKCDGLADCRDKSDESNCISLAAPASQSIMLEYSKVYFSAKGYFPQPPSSVIPSKGGDIASN